MSKMNELNNPIVPKQPRTKNAVLRYSHDRTFDIFTGDDGFQIKVHRSNEKSMSDIPLKIYVRCHDLVLQYNSKAPEECKVLELKEFFQIDGLIMLAGKGSAAQMNGQNVDVYFKFVTENIDGSVMFDMIDHEGNLFSYKVVDDSARWVFNTGVPKSILKIERRSYLSLPGFNDEDEGGDMRVMSYFPEE